MRDETAGGIIDFAFGTRGTTAGMQQRALASQLAGPLDDGFDEDSFHLKGDEGLAAGKMECTAQPIAGSSKVAIQPPCTIPIGL